MIPQVEDYVRGEDEGDHVSEVHASGRRTSSSVEVEWLAGLKLVEDLVELSAGSKRDRSEACKHLYFSLFGCSNATYRCEKKVPRRRSR